MTPALKTPTSFDTADVQPIDDESSASPAAVAVAVSAASTVSRSGPLPVPIMQGSRRDFQTPQPRGMTQAMAKLPKDSNNVMTKEVNLEEWSQFHGIGLCILVDTRVTNLLTLMFATNIRTRLSQLRDGFSNKNLKTELAAIRSTYWKRDTSNEQLPKEATDINPRIHLVQIVTAACSTLTEIDKWNDIECKDIVFVFEDNMFDHFSMDILRQCNVTDGVPKNVGRHSPLKGDAKLNGRRKFLKSVMAHQHCVNVLQVCLIQRMIAAMKHHVNVMGLVHQSSFLPKYKNYVKQIRKLRNETIHKRRCDLTTSAKAELLQNYESFLGIFSFTEFYPHNATNAVSVLECP